MRYELLGLSLAFTAVLLLWVLFAWASRSVWIVSRKRASRWSPRERARWLFALRVGPLLGAMGYVMGVLLPAYVAHEPHVTEEPFSVSLLISAVLCLIAFCVACYRAIVAWRLTQDLLAVWQQGAERISDASLEIPVWRIQHPLPLIGVVGVLHPQLFVAAHLFAKLSPEELTAVLRHEQWHLTARDNFRRVLFDFCRHSFLPGERELEQEWHESVEMAADEYAARQNPQIALDLASALVKIPRLFPTDASVLPNAIPNTISTVLIKGSGLARRVQRLMWVGSELQTPSQKRMPSLLGSSVIGVFLLSLLLAGFHPNALRAVHHGIEIIVSALP